MGAMRIFTGIPLSDGLRKKVLAELQPFRRAGAGVRWTAEPNIHLTLKFIGDVADTLVAPIAAALQAMPAIARFSLRLRGFGKFPAGDELRVFWAGVEASLELNALFAGIEDALAPLGIGRDTRPFKPHLTLGRSAGRCDLGSLFSLLAEKSSLFLGEWTVGAFQLISSRLAPAGPEGPRRGGPVYSVLKEIPLVES
jgi:2'-5' RNA ligase